MRTLFNQIPVLKESTVSSYVIHVILSMQLQPGRVLYAVKNDPPVEYSTSFITNTL